MSNEKKARDFFKVDKPSEKLICKVLLSGNETNGDARYCNKELKNNNNTSVMNGHLTTFHLEVKYRNKKKATETPTSIKHSLLNTNAYATDSDKYRSITECVTEFLVETNQPLSLVDQQPFIKLVSKLDNRYKLPGRQTITNVWLKEKALNVKAAIEQELKEAEFASVTIDGWSSVANDAYLGKHFIYS